MKNIAILVPKGASVITCIEGAYKAFTTANDFLVKKNKKPLFNIQLVGLTKTPQVYDRFFSVQPDLTIKSKSKSDLIIIPPVNGDMKKVIAMNKDFFPWIKNQHKGGAEVASLCVGTFLLASTGLLDEKKCSTHWVAEHEFRKLFPDLCLVSDKIITDEKGVYTSGGANSFWNLLLYIIEKYTNRELAIHLAKYFEIEIDRYDQSSFTIFKGQKDHQDESIKKAQEFIEKNFQHKITIDQLCELFAIGRRNLERRFKKATQNTIIEYVQRVKMESAKKQFETSQKNVNEVMYNVGYSDIKAFRTVFKKMTGLSPIEYRNKYNRESFTIN